MGQIRIRIRQEITLSLAGDFCPTRDSIMDTMTAQHFLAVRYYG